MLEHQGFEVGNIYKVSYHLYVNVALYCETILEVPKAQI